MNQQQSSNLCNEKSNKGEANLFTKRNVISVAILCIGIFVGGMYSAVQKQQKSQVNQNATNAQFEQASISKPLTTIELRKITVDGIGNVEIPSSFYFSEEKTISPKDVAYLAISKDKKVAIYISKDLQGSMFSHDWTLASEGAQKHIRHAELMFVTLPKQRNKNNQEIDITRLGMLKPHMTEVSGIKALWLGARSTDCGTVIGSYIIYQTYKIPVNQNMYHLSFYCEESEIERWNPIFKRIRNSFVIAQK